MNSKVEDAAVAVPVWGDNSAALPPDVRKVSDLPRDFLLFWGFAPGIERVGAQPRTL